MKLTKWHSSNKKIAKYLDIHYCAKVTQISIDTFRRSLSQIFKEILPETKFLLCVAAFVWIRLNFRRIIHWGREWVPQFQEKVCPYWKFALHHSRKSCIGEGRLLHNKTIEFPAVIQSPSKLQSKQPCNVNHVSIVVNKRVFYLLASRAKKAVNIVAWSAKSAKIPAIGKNIQWRIIWFCCSCKKQKQTKTTTKTKQGKKKKPTTKTKKTRHRKSNVPIPAKRQKDLKAGKIWKEDHQNHQLFCFHEWLRQSFSL